jgi:nicotinate-nucleotide adenylyltransferase
VIPTPQPTEGAPKADPLERLRALPGVRLGLMGGTFDPIHVGHLVAAQEALEQFSLDRIVFLPTGTAPHKRYPLTSAELRYTMTVLATAANPAFLVSRLELDRPGTDYTVDTLACVRELLPQAELFFITGADAVLDILAWKDPARILELCILIAATRPGHDLSRLQHVLTGLPARERVKPMEIPGLAVSSSLLRTRVAEGRPVRYLVPEGVWELIEKWGLYRGSSAPGCDEPRHSGGDS